ncbi:hypothetical protein RN22_14200 [Grimontia sp. AD028]|uniref:hypothetical protein n=1 Tax=Grimontia sp. AD028 TaxID=1581149 RepID=UPI00061ADB36|nr:hypothetical protein [Grimontia sp. AD028]KKD59762.1 hypothetical protein RN22_14200 [Grimontia sp. AD028]
MLWHKVQNQLKLHDISLVVGPNRSDKTKFLVEQYGDTPFTIDVSKAKLAYCGGDTTITDEEWQQIIERDCPFITVDDAHLLKMPDLLKLIEISVETKKRLYMSCNETIVSDLPALLTHARTHHLSVVKLERLTANDVCAWVLGEFG